MNSCAASAGLVWTPAALHPKGSLVQPIPFEDSSHVVRLVGGDRRVVRLIVRSARESSPENAAKGPKRDPRQSEKVGGVPAVSRTKTNFSVGVRGAVLNGALGLEGTNVRSLRRSENEGGTQAAPAELSRESKSAQKLAAVAHTNADSSVKTAESATIDTISKVSQSNDGQSKSISQLSTAEASVPDNQAKVCIQCQRAKLPCDFQKIKLSLDGRADACRACLAVLKARRLGQEIWHLQLGVDEAWARAKVCTKCQQTKELRDFSVTKTRRDEVDYTCRSCRADSAQLMLLHAPSDAPQLCFTCHVIKPASEYFKNTRHSTGLEPSCKECHKAMKRVRFQRVAASGAYLPRESKLCNQCKVQKPVSLFYKGKEKHDGLRLICKACESADQKRRYLAKKTGAGLN